jgi:hypothetical protein
MKKNILISLVSDQTIPNVELIKEFKSQMDGYIFVHSKQTVKQLEWILKATDVKNYDAIEVDAFNINDIESKLRSYNFSDDNYHLNITGGTKIMILVFQEFFKNLGAKIFYVTGQDLKYIKVFPLLGQREFTLTEPISLNDYLRSYGFEYSAGNPLNDFDQAKKILKYFLEHELEKISPFISEIRQKRGKSFDISDNDKLKNFLRQMGYEPKDQSRLDKKETRYLTGDWFEEYIYFKVKEELGLSDEEIAIGCKLIKQNIPNEIDVLFVYKHKLYIIECKTSIYDERILPNGSKKKMNLLSEIIYKSDALRNKFGLFSKTSIVTLEEIKTNDGSPLVDHIQHFERADLSKIDIISKKDIRENTSFREIFKIR